MEQNTFGVALEATYKEGYEQGFRDRDHSCDRNASGSWMHWAAADGEQIVRQYADVALSEPQRTARALDKLRVAMVPLRSAYTHAARVDALNRVHGMLFMLTNMDLVDDATLQVLTGEIRDADRAGTDRCKAKSAGGEVSRCMQDDVIYKRAGALMSLQEALEEVGQAPNRSAFESSCIEFEKRLMDAFPGYVDEDELLEWRVFIEAAKSQRLKELA